MFTQNELIIFYHLNYKPFDVFISIRIAYKHTLDIIILKAKMLILITQIFRNNF